MAACRRGSGQGRGALRCEKESSCQDHGPWRGVHQTACISCLAARPRTFPSATSAVQTPPSPACIHANPQAVHTHSFPACIHAYPLAAAQIPGSPGSVPPPHPSSKYRAGKSTDPARGLGHLTWTCCICSGVHLMTHATLAQKPACHGAGCNLCMPHSPTLAGGLASGPCLP